MRLLLLLVFLAGIVWGAKNDDYRRKLNANDKFLDELDSQEILGIAELDTNSEHYRKEFKNVVDNTGTFLPEITEACYRFLSTNLTEQETRLLADIVSRQDAIVLMSHEQLKDAYTNMMNKLLAAAKDHVTIDNIEICKYVITKRQIKSFRGFFEWMDIYDQEEMVKYYKRGEWAELLNAIVGNLNKLYYEKSHLLPKHAMILRKLCTGTAMVALKTTEAQDIFRKLYDNNYYRGAYEWVTYNINASHHHNWHHVQHAYRICLKLESYAPRVINRLDARNTMIDIREIIRQKMETPELANKLDLQHLLDSLYTYLQKTPRNETGEFAESFARYCDKIVDDRNEIVRFSSFHQTIHQEKAAFEEIKCLTDRAHSDFHKKVTHSASELLNSLEPYCQYGIELACSSKYGTTFNEHKWFERPFNDVFYNLDWAKYKPWDTKHHWNIQKLVDLAKKLKLKH
ncbi:unnamed protein product [Caenorhabditis angaria]|uniref:Uncharacterized protein n=1 Tax=Caenorhabditis angaria TaxID=860376 RepID=A0A9P1I6T0_9PELO|nr:unnamed protein product [Caenorhabditis angaria]